MSQQVANVDAETMPAVHDEATALISMIERAASNPAVDIDKMERLLMMQERVMERRAMVAFNAALAEVQFELPEIDENGGIKDRNGNVQSTYAYYEDINDAIKPILHTHGFSLRFRPGKADGLITTTAILAHKDGHSEEATVELLTDASGSKNAVQGIGSSLSYGKRYAAILLLNITTRNDPNDNDGQTATKQKAGITNAQANESGVWPACEADFRACKTVRELAQKSNEYRTKLPAKWLGNMAELYDTELARIKSAEFGVG